MFIIYFRSNRTNYYSSNTTYNNTAKYYSLFQSITFEHHKGKQTKIFKTNYLASEIWILE